jgi:hypothetical protein
MHALLLALALGQATPAPDVQPGAPAPATSLPASPEPAALDTPVAPTLQARPLRTIELARLPDGSFRASLDGQAVAGADFYRAVLRPDLAARSEQARADRAALYLAAGLAPLAGFGIGLVAGTAQQWPLPPCVGAPPDLIPADG